MRELGGYETTYLIRHDSGMFFSDINPENVPVFCEDRSQAYHWCVTNVPYKGYDRHNNAFRVQIGDRLDACWFEEKSEGRQVEALL